MEEKRPMSTTVCASYTKVSLSLISLPIARLTNAALKHVKYHPSIWKLELLIDCLNWFVKRYFYSHKMYR